MENNDSNLKPQTTGGLKLMTVFIAVLALHVLVIGSFGIYSLLKRSNSDTDLAADKTHKDAKIAADAITTGDVASTDSTAADKSAGATAPSTMDTTTTTDGTADSTTSPTVATDVTGASTTTTPGVTPATAPATTTTATPDNIQPRPGSEPLMVSPPPNDASSIAAGGPTSDTPSGPIQHGPVINPPENLAPPADTSTTAATASVDANAPVADGTPYTVHKGDSLARIAHRHHVALAQLKLANSLTNDRLKIGQKLVIPNHAEKVAATDASEAASAPQLSSTTPDETAKVPADSGDTSESTASVSPKTEHAHLHSHKAAVTGHHLYTVVRGDTLMKIARRFRTTAGAIMAENGITNASRLSIGKKLRIPGGDSRSAAASSREPAPTERESHTAAHGQLANYVP
jgi:LysM repeat protein